MKAFKPEYRDKKTGKRKKCNCWALTFVDNKRKRRKLSCFTSKRATERVGDRIQDLLAEQGRLTPELQSWIDTIPDRLRDKLIEWGLIDESAVTKHINKSLKQHLEDFIAGMQADNRAADHIRQSKSSVIRILDGCNFKKWSDIDGNQVKDFLAKGRGPDGYGERAYNAYLQCFKTFTGWMMREGRATGKNPMRHCQPIRQTHYRHPRRAMTPEEARRFLEAVETAPKRWKMTGHERALAYKMALQCGLRANEIQTLQKLSFNFDASPATVTVEAKNAKGKRTDELILMDDTARELREHLKDKKPQDTAFNFPCSTGRTTMMQQDLGLAGIPYMDEAGRHCDFHALRHSYISHLALAGVHPSVCQKLARHADIKTTMQFYTHVLRQSEVSAIDALRDWTYTGLANGHSRTQPDKAGQRNRDNGLKTALSA